LFPKKTARAPALVSDNVILLEDRIMFSPGPLELVVIAAIALLLFGSRLPSVMGSLGRGIVEFKKGMRGIEDEIEDASSRSEKRTVVSQP
jgi:sec-independent protein translocase protein TatA